MDAFDLIIYTVFAVGGLYGAYQLFEKHNWGRVTLVILGLALLFCFHEYGKKQLKESSTAGPQVYADTMHHVVVFDTVNNSPRQVEIKTAGNNSIETNPVKAEGSNSVGISTPPVANAVQPCETTNTGDVTFKNNSSRDIYIYYAIYAGSMAPAKFIKVLAKSPGFIGNLEVNNSRNGLYEYKVTFVKAEDDPNLNHINSETSGSFVIQKCSNSVVDINL